MNNASDFVIENGALIEYKGPGGDVVIPEGVTEIGKEALRWKGLTSVTLPSTLKRIGQEALSFSRLTGVVIPEGVTTIDDQAFKYCDKLESIVLPNSLTEIGYGAFSDCPKLQEVTLSQELKMLGRSVFYDCKGLKRIHIPRGIDCIRENTFYNCESLEQIEIPEGVTSIESNAFSGCINLREIVLPSSLESIGSMAFSLCRKLGEIAFPSGLKHIGESAFYACGLKRLVLPPFISVIEGSTYGLCGTFDSCGALAEVTLPDELREIGSKAFNGCKALETIRIPKSVRRIDNGAFAGCSQLREIVFEGDEIELGSRTFLGCSKLADENGFVIVRHVLYGFVKLSEAASVPKGVKAISGAAFYGKKTLKQVVIPEGVTSIGREAFSWCNALEQVSFPSTLTDIGSSAFYGCLGLQELALPESLRRIGGGVFENCEHLSELTLPMGLEELGKEAMKGCSGLKLLSSTLLPTWRQAPGNAFILFVPGETNRWYAYTAKSDCDNLSDFAHEGGWADYDRELINNGPKYKYKLTVRLMGMLGRLLDPVELTEDNRSLFAEMLNKNAKKLVPLAEELGREDILQDLLGLGVLDEQTLKAVRKLMVASAVDKIAALSSLEAQTATYAPQKKKLEAPKKDPLQAEYAAKLKAIKGDSVIKKMKLIGTDLPKVKMVDGSEAPEELFRFLLAAYGTQLGGAFHFEAEADEAARLLAYDSLCEVIDAVSGHLDGPNYPAVLPLLCRYGNALQIRSLTDAFESWGTWRIFGQKGRSAQQILMDAMILSDTREAVIWLEKRKGLSAYAALRGISEAEVYEQYLFNFGFDENGKRVFDLGVTTVEVTLTRELSLALFDTEKKKAVRAIPKKGVDPAVQKKAADELADMRQNLKKAVKIKNDQLYRAFWEGTTVAAEKWKQRYPGNAFLRRVAELLVWSQAGKSFLLTDDGLIDSDGQPYSLGDGPVAIAHPMEMPSEEILKWQRYFTARGLKQPFQQIWEPVIDPKTVREDRYAGCRINPIYLKNQKRRGIEAEWYEMEYYGSKYVRIEGFQVEAEDADDMDDNGREYLEIVRLKPEIWNRRANGVIAFLDRITVYERIKKDDVSTMDLMDGFTLAQITEFITAAQEANANNVLAALLDYKNTHFADFDPMAEFTLEW